MNKFAEHKGQQFLLLFFIIFWLILSINVSYLGVWIAENILLILSLIYLVESYKNSTISSRSYLLIFVFAIIQTIGSHFSYAEVPFAFVSELFSFERNHYDRLVHFSFGLLLALPVKEVLSKFVSFSSAKTAMIIIIMLFFALGSIYEILEWQYALILEDTDDATLVLGAQGDIWDAQIDMFLAGLGAFIAILFIKNKPLYNND